MLELPIVTAEAPGRRWAARLGPALIILSLVIGIEAFLGSQRSVVSTGSALCCTKVKTTSKSGAGDSGSNNSTSHGMLALSGSDTSILVVVAVAAMAGGLLLVRVSRRTRPPA